MCKARQLKVFKTKRFDKSARAAAISDAQLCKAFDEIVLGQCIDLGGGVFKKRLNKNLHRSILLASSGVFWVYEYLFAKNDRDNILDQELDAFRLLARSYSALNDSQLTALIAEKQLVEICHDDKKKF